MKKYNKLFSNIAAVLIFIMVISGLFLIWYQIENAQKHINEAEDRHLQEQAGTADSDIVRRMRIIHSTISGAVHADAVREGEAQYVATGDTEALAGAIRESILCRSEYAIETVVFTGGDELIRCPGNRGAISEELPSGTRNRFSLIRDRDNHPCFAFSETSLENDIEYVSVFTVEPVLANMSEPVLSDGAIVILYDVSTGTLVTEKAGSLRSENLSGAGSADSEIINAVSSIEENGQPETRYCVYFDEAGDRHDLGIALIPSGQSMNGRFAVGVAVDYTEFMMDNIRTSRRTVSIMLLIMLGLLFLFILFQFIYRRNLIHEKKARELNELNRETEERLRNTQILEQRERLETIGVLTSSIAHEFNNLLTPIMGYSALSIADLTDENEELAENLSEIYNASSRAKQLIARMASFSRVTDSASFQYLSPDTVIEDVRLMAKPAVPSFVEVQESLNCPEPCIYGDRMQLIQMFLNIVLNAFQAMRDGGILKIHTGIRDGKVTVVFQDTGKGMTGEELSRIFEPFYTTKGDAGTGLGLPISKRIAETHGAEITVKSEPGKGTEFSVIFQEKKKEA